MPFLWHTMSSDQAFDLFDFVLYQNNEKDAPSLQHAIDGVNMAAREFPNAWKFVAKGGLIEANSVRGGNEPLSPIAISVFDQMEQDGHSGATAAFTIHWLTKLAKQRFPPE